MLTSSETPAMVERFDKKERFFHWAFSAPLLITFATGFGLYFQALEKFFGSREILRDVHRFAGLATVLIPLAVYVAGNRGRLNADAAEIDAWSATDRLWMKSWLRRRVGENAGLPPQGRFNAGQKANAVITAAAVFWLSVTGLLIYPGIHPPFDLVQNARTLHNLTWWLFVPIVVGHVYLAAVHGPTKPGLGGIFGGKVSLDWLRRHHPLSPEANHGVGREEWNPSREGDGEPPA